MNQPLARTNGGAIAIGEQYGFDAAKVQLIKDQIAKGATDDELALFLYTAQRTGLDPLARQIYCIMRKDKGVDKMTIQTGIDGYRLLADRTGNYAPGRASTYEYDQEGRLYSATAYVMKFARGTWHEVGAVAIWSEYVATYKDGNPMGLWGSKPHIMLAKCAEALALRRAFPAELSGVYTDTEMGDDGPHQQATPQPGVIDVPSHAHEPIEDAERHALVGRLRTALRGIKNMGIVIPVYTPDIIAAWSFDQLVSKVENAEAEYNKLRTPADPELYPNGRPEGVPA
jgi:phage recombination protein Bet